MANKKAFSKSLTESLDMANFLVERYPDLAGPEEYVNEADELLTELHKLDYYVLCFFGNPYFSTKTVDGIKERLARPISKRYGEALKSKLAA